MDKINYKIIERIDLKKGLKEVPKGDITFDYEANALDTWAPNTTPFGFGITPLDEFNPTTYYFDINDPLTRNEKRVLAHYLKSRKVWVFNASYEISLTWAWLGEFIEMEDVFCLFKVDGCILSLKNGATKYLNIPSWAGDPWESVGLLKDITKYCRERYREKVDNGKKYKGIAEFITRGEIRNAMEWANDHQKEFKKFEKDAIIVITKLLKFGLTQEEISEVIIAVDFDETLINLSHIPRRMVAEYCAKDAYYTCQLKHHLWDRCKEAYPIYIRQTYLSIILTSYSCKWDIAKVAKLEIFYDTECIKYLKKLYSIPQFKIRGLDPALLIKMDSVDDRILLKKTYWNPSSTGEDAVGTFYDCLYSSSKMLQTMIAYHIFKFAQGYEDMKDEDGILLSTKLKYNTMKEIVPKIKSWLQRHGSVNSDGYNDDLTAFKNNLYYATTISKWYNDSLDMAHMETFYSAACQCGTTTPNDDFEDLDWELQVLYCVKIVKKMEKSLNTYINGKVGRENVRDCTYSNDLLEMPDRTKKGNNDLFQVSFFENGAITKRWRAGCHTIPWHSELRELLITRLEDTLLIHYDYSQAEVRVLAAMANETAMLNAFADGIDIHRWNASKIWKKAQEDVKDSERRFAKMATFSILYGKSRQAFANDFMGGDLNAANKLFDDFFAAFPRIDKWCKEQHRMVIEHGYVKTMFGDKIYIPFDPSRQSSINRAKRESQNYPIQNGASNLAALGAMDLFDEIKKYKLQAIPFMFQHDAIDWEVKIKHFVYFMRLANKIAVMDIRKKWNTPMAIDFEVGINQNFMLSMENPVFENGGVEFEFECAYKYFDKIVGKLKSYWVLDYEITKEKDKKESMDELFKTKRAFSMYIGENIKYYYGKMSLKKPVRTQAIIRNKSVDEGVLV